MSLDPRTPVLVGVGVVQQREEDPARAHEPLELMAEALERAALDAGDRCLLRDADSIRAPRGFWRYADPCRALAERFGASSAKTEVSEIGVLQTSLFGRAARDIAQGHADIVLIAGGEARYRARRARAAGIEPRMMEQPEGLQPDSVLRPTAAVVSDTEIQSGLTMPVGAYAVVENALRAREGTSLETHRREVALLWAGMSRVAAQNPHAWKREIVSPESIREASEKNPMLAFPYTKLHNSQWNVDQAAGLIFCSAEKASRLGIPRDRWVFPLCVAENNYMLAFSERREIDRCPGFARAAEAAFQHASCDPKDVTHLELYSCFPSAVRIQLQETGVRRDQPVTVTGGMAFAGGPLNNFVLQAQARMAEVLRADPGSLGLVTAISGFLTKQGVGLWSTEPRDPGFRYEDVSRETESDMDAVELATRPTGRGRVAGYTVFYEDARPSRSVFLCDLEDGRRAVVVHPDASLAEESTRVDACGREVQLSGDNLAFV